MYSRLARLGLAAAFALPALGFLPAIANADTLNINFEGSPTYTVANINGQNGWSNTGLYDANVVATPATTLPASFGTQALQISDKQTSGSFGDQIFTPSLVNEAGETDALSGGVSGGTRQNHFEAQFDIDTTLPAFQAGEHLSVSPDRGDGARMSYLRFEDHSSSEVYTTDTADATHLAGTNYTDGVHVYFDDVTDPSHAGDADTFNETDIATLSRGVHTVKFVMDFVDGPDNDVVKIYIDGNLVATGGSWEDYYRFDTESNPGLAQDNSRTVDSLLFRESGTANGADSGNGFLVDNLSLSSSTVVPACVDNATHTIVSDTSTQVDGHGAPALSFVHPAWTASIPDATWIWSDNPVVDPTVDTTKTFTHDFTVTGTPLNADLMIATDNSYSVSVNGTPVGADSSGDNFDLANQDDISIPAADLVTGVNTLSITVDNFATPGDSNPQDNPAGLLYKLTFNDNECQLPPPPPTSVKVTIDKFIDGTQATVVNANSASFPMSSTWNAANIGAGTGTYALNSSDAYQAVTADMSPGASYSTSETLDNVTVGASCDAGAPFALVGYTTGDTLAAAAAGTPSSAAPSFDSLAGDKYVIVWNHACPAVPQIKVHIAKYLDGVLATAATANNYLFPMVSTWSAANIGAGSGNYTLGNNFGGAADLYGADTASMSVPANYSTSEVTSDIDATSNVVPTIASCSPGKTYLVGYKTSPTSFADAAAQLTDNSAPPAFTDLESDRYVVVDNATCPTTATLTVDKDAIGGNGTFNFTGPAGVGSFQITTVAGVGNKTFTGLTPGVYTITEATQKGWTQTDSTCSITLGAGDNVVCTITNTSNKLLGEIRGVKYEDRDGDGKLTDGDHHRLSGWTIYLDTNNNGALDSGEPSTVTDSHGVYHFLNLPAGTYHVREVGQTGWTQTVPSSGVYNITLAAGQIAKNKDFGNFHQGTISGMKYGDTNANGRKDAGEVGLGGWTINLKKGNAVVATTVTLADGSYTFTNVAAGVYTLSEVAQAGWIQTDHPGAVWVRSGTNAKHEDFGNHQGPLPKHGKH